MQAGNPFPKKNERRNVDVCAKNVRCQWLAYQVEKREARHEAVTPLLHCQSCLLWTMSADPISVSADAAAGASFSVKRELDVSYDVEPPSKVMKTDAPQSAPPTASDTLILHEPEEEKATITKKVRLEQNRKAAKESRRRKKIMIEELQRSVRLLSWSTISRYRLSNQL